MSWPLTRSFLTMPAPSQVRVLCPLFVMTVRPYLEVADHWMTEGNLRDIYNEFFVERWDQVINSTVSVGRGCHCNVTSTPLQGIVGMGLKRNCENGWLCHRICYADLSVSCCNSWIALWRVCLFFCFCSLSSLICKWLFACSFVLLLLLFNCLSQEQPRHPGEQEILAGVISSSQSSASMDESIGQQGKRGRAGELISYYVKFLSNEWL